MVLQSAYSLVQYALHQNLEETCQESESLKSTWELSPKLSIKKKCIWCAKLILSIHGNQTTAWRERKRVINSNWDISAGPGNDWVNVTLEQCFWWSQSPICCTQEHICARCPRRTPLAENTSIPRGREGEKVRHHKHYYASRQQISILIAPQLY